MYDVEMSLKNRSWFSRNIHCVLPPVLEWVKRICVLQNDWGACFRISPKMVILFILVALNISCSQSQSALLPDHSSTPDQTIWVPEIDDTWQIQLSNPPIDVNVDADIFEIDLFDNSEGIVATLHTKGKKVVCYVSVGSWENWRPDAMDFPEEVLGNTLEGWPDERWLDIRQVDILLPLMKRRFELCKNKGFDGVDPDNVDGYTHDTGFPLTAQDQIRYNRAIAELAHELGLSVALKNDLDQIDDLLPYFDWMTNEQCFEWNECDAVRKFIQSGKAVVNIEYNLEVSQFCPQANAWGFFSMKKHLELDAYREPCR